MARGQLPVTRTVGYDRAALGHDGNGGADPVAYVPAAGAGGPSPDPPAGGAAPRSTRELILDVALDLFIEKGVDKTSLREVAEQLGITKAAIYYHFASKEEIVMALHLRLHEIGRQAISRLGQLPSGMDSWARLLDQAIVEMLANRKIFLMHERNRSALEAIHRKDHDADHGDLVEQISRLVGDPSLPLRDRVRIGCSIGAVMTGIVLSGQLLQETTPDELARLLREAVGDLLGRRPTRRSPPRATSDGLGVVATRPAPEIRPARAPRVQRAGGQSAGERPPTGPAPDGLDAGEARRPVRAVPPRRRG